MPVKKPSVGQLFANAGVGQSGQVLELKDRVEELEAEVLRLRADPTSNQDLEHQVQILTEQLQGKDGEHEIPIDLIDPDPNQPRRTITDAMKVSRAESLREYGQLQPIIVIPQLDGRYRLFEGELRWRAAPLVPMTMLRAVFLQQEQDAATVFRGQLLTRLHNEDLHDLDLAEALLQDIRYQTEWSDDQDIPQVLDEGIRYLRKLNRLRELSQLKQQSRQTQQEWVESIDFPNPLTPSILSILLDLHLNPASVCSNIFPLLSVPEDVKHAIRTTGLDSSKARSIARLEDQEDRSIVLQLAIDGLSLEEVRKQVAHLQMSDPPQLKSSGSLKQQFTGNAKRLQKSSIWKDPSKQVKLESLMVQIEELLQEG